MIHSHHSHISLCLTLVVCFQTSEHQSTKDHVTYHETAGADCREEKGDKLATAVGTALTTGAFDNIFSCRLSFAVARVDYDVFQFYVRLRAEGGRLVVTEFHASDPRQGSVIWKALGEFFVSFCCFFVNSCCSTVSLYTDV